MCVTTHVCYLINSLPYHLEERFVTSYRINFAVVMSLAVDFFFLIIIFFSVRKKTKVTGVGNCASKGYI